MKKGETIIKYDENKLTIENSHGLRILGVCGTKSVLEEANKVVYSREGERGDGIVSVSDFKQLIIKEHEDITCSIGVGDSLIDLIIFIDDKTNPEKLLSYFKSAIEVKDEILGPLTRFYKSNIILIIGKKGQGRNLKKQKIKKHIKKSLIETLKTNNISILDQLKEKGINLDELAKAGIKLCVGVKVDDKLRKKLKKQLIKSLSDINVITLILAAIRAEEDLQHHRIKNVNIDDDPAHLYSDEVLGMAVANQIAGTKAIFNFKRYDEEKPGIISRLGPMTDDVIAGLIAGTMSKIFEE